MRNTKYTLLDLIHKCHSNMDDVYRIIHEETQGNYLDIDKLSLDKIKKGYGKVVDVLLKKPKQPDLGIKHEFEIIIHDMDIGELNSDGPPLIENPIVSLYNLNYVTPPPNTEPWGGDPHDEFDAPEGRYNINFPKYNKYFSMEYEPWGELINYNIRVETKKPLSYSAQLAHILWEMTYVGFTEEEVEKNKQHLLSLIEISKDKENQENN